MVLFCLLHASSAKILPPHSHIAGDGGTSGGGKYGKKEEKELNI